MELLEEIKDISEMANFIYVRQKGPYGNGTPVLAGEPIIDGEAFAVLWGDEFVYSDPPRLSQMIKVYETIQYEKCVKNDRFSWKKGYYHLKVRHINHEVLLSTKKYSGPIYWLKESVCGADKLVINNCYIFQFNIIKGENKLIPIFNTTVGILFRDIK